MDEQKDGGRAYPTNLRTEADGMTLLDYFAGQALVGLLPRYGDSWMYLYPPIAYKLAKQMLEEREKYLG